MRSMGARIAARHRLFGSIGAIGAGAIAILYLVLVPEKALYAGGLVKLFLLYGHSLCWILIAGASGLWALKGMNRWSIGLLYTALVVYIGFLVSMVAAPNKSVSPVDSFESCKAAGGSIAESYPEQCFLQGKSFVNHTQHVDASASEYIGLAEQAAVDKATRTRTPHRVVERDGMQLPVTMDFAPGRLNFYLKDGMVYKVQVEGRESP